MRIRARRVLTPAPFVLTLCVSIACQSPKPAPPPDPPPYRPTATIKDLMLSVIDTNADVVWNSVSTVHTVKGTVETKPRTEEDWLAVRHGEGIETACENCHSQYWYPSEKRLRYEVNTSK